MAVQPAQTFLTNFSVADNESSVSRSNNLNAIAMLTSLGRSRASNQAYERGYSDGQKDANSKSDAAIAKLKDEMEQSFATSRTSWVDGESLKISESVKRQFDQLEEMLVKSVSELLVHFLHDAIRAKSVEILRETITDILADREAVRITVSGPSDLIEKLRNSESLKDADFEAGGPELRVHIDNTIVETRITKWIDTMRAALQ